MPEVGGAETVAYVFKTIADPYSGKISLLRVFAGTLASDSTLTNNHSHGKERIGQLLLLQGKDHTPTDELGPGAIGAVAKLKDIGTGDVLSDSTTRPRSSRCRCRRRWCRWRSSPGTRATRTRWSRRCGG